MSKTHKMVQSYYNEELNDVMFQIEALDEWRELASSLGMDKQLDFVKSATSPIPYPNINKSMELIFSTLCPTKVNFRDYRKTPIPLEVLKQIGMSVTDKHFKRIEIWSDDKAPDPCVVGITEKHYVYNKEYAHLKGADGTTMLFDTSEEAKAYADLVGFQVYGSATMNIEKYLIARWGDEIKPLSELKKMATERLLEKYGAELRNEIEERTQALKKLTDNVTLYLNAEITENQLKGGRW